jgi:uncharacterized phage-associated protein
MKSANEIANAFLRLNDPDLDGLTNLKIQKLLYYVQGFHLAMYDKPIFEEKIMAWEHGPVVPEIYHRFKHLGSNIIPAESRMKIPKLTKKEMELIIEVNDIYGQFSAWKLRNMTHEETPWKETKLSREITETKLKRYFTELLIEE